MFDKDYNLKLMDFACAIPLTGDKLKVNEVGTTGFMAPEQHLGIKCNAKKVDVFALGVVLFIMLS